jgi:cytochrome c oxidase assembly protein subunit 15
VFDRLPTVSPKAYRWITLVVLASLVFITLAGAVVRLTDSGLGCETWPACEDDSFTPRGESGSHAVIEFANRLVTGVVGVAALAAIYGAHRRTPRRGALVAWSWQVLAWVIVNALVGAVVVKYDLLPATVMVHFLLAMAAIWSAVVLDHKAAQPEPVLPDAANSTADAAERGRPLAATGVRLPGQLRRASGLLLAASVVTVIIGTLVTAAGPHAGDENAERLSVDVGDIARIHGLSALAVVVLALWTSWLAFSSRAPAVVMDRLRWLSLVIIGQAVLGYVQYFSGVPPVLVAAHVLGSALVWIAALRVWLVMQEPRNDLRTDERPARDVAVLAGDTPAHH